MKRNNVISESIESIGYDSQTKTLEVEFIRGRIYQYYKFTDNDYAKLLQASLTGSIGSYFSKNIAKKFKYKKVED